MYDVICMQVAISNAIYVHTCFDSSCFLAFCHASYMCRNQDRFMTRYYIAASDREQARMYAENMLMHI